MNEKSDVIKRLTHFAYSCPLRIYKGLFDDLRLAIAALEKQVAKEVTNDGAFGDCPSCGYEFNSELVNEYEIQHCPDCGQRLKWED